MKLRRMGLALVLVAFLAGVAYVGQTSEPAGAKMASAAEKFLDTLKKDQRDKATYAFDDPERFRWFFTPRQDEARRPTRNGLPLEDMTEGQRKAAVELVRAGTSMEGAKAALAIMSLEAVLNELEKGGRMVRDPEWYFFTVFGTPSKTGKWGWRVEGHHLSLNFTLDGGQVVSATPAFFGANPATLLAGPRKGQQTLPESETLARELFRSLDEDQQKVARQDKQFPEIQENTREPKVGEPVGLAAGRMTPAQQKTLWRLIEAYAERMPPEVAEHQLGRVKKAGLDKVHFAFAGGLEPREPHTYRVQGPTFVIEFLNTQADSAGNKANHIHSCWRNVDGDFGLARQ